MKHEILVIIIIYDCYELALYGIHWQSVIKSTGS